MTSPFCAPISLCLCHFGLLHTSCGCCKLHPDGANFDGKSYTNLHEMTPFTHHIIISYCHLKILIHFSHLRFNIKVVSSHQDVFNAKAFFTTSDVTIRKVERVSKDSQPKTVYSISFFLVDAFDRWCEISISFVFFLFGYKKLREGQVTTTPTTTHAWPGQICYLELVGLT